MARPNHQTGPHPALPRREPAADCGRIRQSVRTEHRPGHRCSPQAYGADRVSYPKMKKTDFFDFSTLLLFSKPVISDSMNSKKAVRTLTISEQVVSILIVKIKQHLFAIVKGGIFYAMVQM